MIRVTEKARERIINVLKAENATMVRFGLKGGGCSGFTYYFSVESEKTEDDYEVVLSDEQSMIIDSMSMTYLMEAELDYVSDMMGERFVYNNPNAQVSCGCGNSVNF